MMTRLLILIDVLFCSRHRRAALGLPGRGVRPSGEHREVQQPPLRQEQERRLCAGGQLPAERAGPARGAARGLPLQLRDVAGAGGLLPAHPVGGAAAGPVTAPGGPGVGEDSRWMMNGGDGWKQRVRKSRAKMRECTCGCCGEAALVVAADHRTPP